jgi:class 3 adenylate cyclase/pimeloyl-ACP methyl ester carboxylesterase
LIENLDPEAAREILDQAIGSMMAAVHRYEGTVNKVLGDGIMALFGAPIAQEDHAVRACYAALAIQRELPAQAAELRRTYGGELCSRVGLHSGEVVVRAIGNDLSMDYDAIGPTVHLASRMEQLASPGSIQLTAATAHLAEGFIEAEPLGNISIKGLSEPVTAFALKGVGPSRTRLQAATARGLTGLVGRASEMGTLEGARDWVERGRGQIVVVVGEPGAGKSRLFYEFVRSHRMREWLVLETTSNSGGQASPWSCAIDLLRQYFQIIGDDDNKRISEKVAGKLLTLDATLRPVLPALLALLDIPVDDAEWLRLGASQRRRRTLDGIRATLIRESASQPVALVLDDMHWMDTETRALVDALVESVPAARMLVLANYRPEFRHDWGGGGALTRIRLEPLGEADLDRMLSVLLGDDATLSDLKQKLIERAEGNPLCLEEYVRGLLDTGTLEGAKGHYRLTRRLDGIEIPPAMATMIAARIDRLPSAQKALLEIAAVCGEEAHLVLLEAVSELSKEDLYEALADLRTREFLQEVQLFPDIVYRFRHGLTRRVAYDRLLRQTRSRLHRHVGEALEGHAAGHAGEVLELLARHFELSDAFDKAAAYYLRAAERAKERYAYATASDFARSARELDEHSDDPVRLAHASEMLGDLSSLTGEMEAANDAYDAALTLTYEPEARQRIQNKRHRPGFAFRDGVRIAFYEHGNGDDTLIFINPIVYGLEVFQPILEQLCQEFRIITIDPRGTGRSSRLHRPYSLAEHVEDVRAVIEQAGGPVSTVGISRGSNLVIRLADAYPTLVTNLILVGALPDSMGPGCPIQRLDYLNAIPRFLEAGDVEGLVRFHVYRVYSEPDTRELAESSIARLLGMPRETLLSFYDPDETMDVKPLLGQVRAPTLVMHGMDDKQVPFTAGEYMAARIPEAKLYSFRGRGHLPLFTATLEFCGVLRHFLRTADIPPPP